MPNGQNNFFGMPMNGYGGNNAMSPQNSQFMDLMGMNNYGGGNTGSNLVRNTGGAVPTTDNFMSGVSPTNPSGGESPGMHARLFGGTDADGNQMGGMAMPAIQLGTGLMNGYLGMKQYGLAKDQLRESKRQFQKNYDNQVQTTNTQLRDRQRARRAANPGAHQSVDEYMKENRVGG